MSSDQDKIVEIRRKVEERKAADQVDQPPTPPTPSGPEPPDTDFIWQCFNSSEIGDSMLYNYLHRGRFVHNHDSKSEWLVFQNHSWHLDATGRSLDAVEAVCQVYLSAALSIREDLILAESDGNAGKAKKLQARITAINKRVERLRKWAGRETLLKCAATNSAPLTIGYDDMDRDPWLLAVANGVIDLRTGKLRPGRPEDYITKASPIEFTGIDTPAPAWEKFLAEAIDNPDVVAYLHKVIGYSITGLTTVRIFPIFYGERGQNGKGTILEILFHILGPLAGPIQSEMLISSKTPKSSSGPSPDIMDLKGKRLVWGSETEEGQRFAAAKVKLLTGGDALVGRNPNDRYQTTFQPTHKLYLLTNSKPGAPADDNAFWERARQITFPYTFTSGKITEKWQKPAETGLSERLKSEASGILAWMVRGCLLWQKHGLQTPDIIISETAQYRRAEDILQDFLDACVYIDPDQREGSTDLYHVFKAWWEANVSKRSVPSHRKFGDLMTKRFAKETPKGSVEYLGLEIKRDTDYWKVVKKEVKP